MNGLRSVQAIHPLAIALRADMLPFTATDWFLCLTGFALAVFLISFGVLLGKSTWRFGTMRRLATALTPELEQVRGLTSGVAEQVEEYRRVVDDVTRKLRAVGAECGPGGRNPTTIYLAELDAANRRLQSSLKRAEDLLHHQSDELASYVSEACTDSLTGLPNRRVLFRELRRRLVECRHAGTSLSVLFLDVDHFKQFNDEYGHLVGDQVLARVGKVLAGTMRERDLVARYGGEEFAVVVSRTDSDEVSQIAERIRLAIEQSGLVHEGETLRVTASIGVAHAMADDTSESLLGRADAALYASKALGRNLTHWNDGRRCIPLSHYLLAEGPDAIAWHVESRRPAAIFR